MATKRRRFTAQFKAKGSDRSAARGPHDPVDRGQVRKYIRTRLTGNRRDNGATMEPARHEKLATHVRIDGDEIVDVDLQDYH